MHLIAACSEIPELVTLPFMSSKWFTAELFFILPIIPMPVILGATEPWLSLFHRENLLNLHLSIPLGFHIVCGSFLQVAGTLLL